MKRYLLGLVLLFCLLVSADAQFACLNLLGCSTGGISFTGAGDVVSGAQAWYGMRAYNAAYATANGKIVNVVRSSDSQACDILAASGGGLGITANCTGAANGTAATTFCNATTCTVITLYDQSGALACSSAACDLTQGTAASRPTLILNCISGNLPCMTFASGQSLPNSTGITASDSAFTISTVARRTSGTTSYQTILATTTNGWGAGYNNTANNALVNQGNVTVITTASDNAFHAMQFIGTSSTTSFVQVDATAGTQGNAGANAFTGTFNIGVGSGNQLLGNVIEVGLYASNFTGTQITNMCHNQHLYWGTSVSC